MEGIKDASGSLNHVVKVPIHLQDGDVSFVVDCSNWSVNVEGHGTIQDADII